MEIASEKIRYKNKYYGIINVQYKDIYLPLLLDWKDFIKIDNLKKDWKCNKYGFVSCNHTTNNICKEVFIHKIIMAYKQRDSGKNKLNMPIIHINKIGLDNRRDNLLYSNTNHFFNVKKKRIIELPPDSDIDVQDIPTFISYMKPNKTHGDRFMVSVGKIKWKTTSSKKFTLKQKLEEAKKYLRTLQEKKPELFNDHSMNGDPSKKAKILLKTFYSIVKRSKYNYVDLIKKENSTNTYLKENVNKIKSNNTKKLLKQNNRNKNSILDSPVIIKDNQRNTQMTKNLPKYCYYKLPYKNKGDYFIIKNHPKLEKPWYSKTSKKISLEQKYNQTMDHIKLLNQ